MKKLFCDEMILSVDVFIITKFCFIYRSGSETGHPLCVMASLFRLLRSLQFRISNNLESVDGLLGCPVAMPKDLNDLIDDFQGLSRDEQILVLDSLFYCINWFRELINAFSLINEQELQMKVSKIFHLTYLIFKVNYKQNYMKGNEESNEI